MAWTINNGKLYFNTNLYTGDGSTSRSITGVGFQPDWVWVKSRSATYYHGLWDAVRTNKSALYSNVANAEDTSTGGTLGSLDSDGFTTQNVSGGFINNNGTTYASWNWLGANGTASNTTGSIDSTVSANTTSGFSIVSWTGNGGTASVGHGLGVKPNIVIKKNRGASTNWIFSTTIIDGSNDFFYLNSTNAKGDSGETAPTASLINLFANDENNGNGNAMIAYCFAEKQGFSKFGSYTGNGNANGTFVYTGFKPAFVMIKKTSGTSNWTIWDSVRQSNEINKPLWADLNSAEAAQSTVKLDLLSNSFKIRGNGSNVGSSGGSYIYMAFAENPFTSSAGTPVTAR